MGCPRFPNKTRYTSEAHALRVLLKRAREAVGLRMYECRVCKGWHLTKIPSP